MKTVKIKFREAVEKVLKRRNQSRAQLRVDFESVGAEAEINFKVK
jgi:hypothetical protein